MMGWTLMSSAQRYEIDRGRVYFGNEMIMEADARSFVDLGCGYAKDRMNVYMNGYVLDNVDPSTFRLKERSVWGRRNHEGKDGESDSANKGYRKTTFNVYYGDKKIDATASSFEELGDGYAKDSFNAFYCGEKIKGCMASSFKVLGGGYAKESFDVYYRGIKVDGARASSFKYTGNGYGQDSFDIYYKGKKLK